MLLYYYVIMLLYYYINILLYYYITILLYYYYYYYYFTSIWANHAPIYWWREMTRTFVNGSALTLGSNLCSRI